MKKALLGTSALVGAGLLAFSPAPASANDLELSISGSAAFAVYSIDGDDYRSAARSSITYAARTRADNQAYRVCWNGKAGDDAAITTTVGSSDGVAAACGASGTDTGSIELASAPFTAGSGTDIPAGALVVNTPAANAGDRVESNDIGITRGSNRLVFDTKGTMDNGLTVGSRVRLEARSGVDDPVDEHYVWVEGGFGLFQVGAKNAAGYQMHYAAPGLANNAVDSPLFRNAQRSATAGTETYVNLTEDAYKLNYFTPRFNGLQLGASYVPNGSDNGKASSAVYDAREVNLQDVYSLGANYVNAIGDVDVAFSAGYATGTARDKNADGTARACHIHPEFGTSEKIVVGDTRGSFRNGTVTTATIPAKCEDPSEWSLGTNLSMSGFTIGGAYNVEENIKGVKGTERTSWSAAATYAQDDWSVGVGYYLGTLERGGRFAGTTSTVTSTGGTGEISPPTIVVGPPVAGPNVDGTVKWDDGETTFLLLGANYKLGPGVNLGAEVQIIEDTDPIAVVSGTNLVDSVRTAGPESVKTNSFGLTLGLSF